MRSRAGAILVVGGTILGLYAIIIVQSEWFQTITN